LHLEIRFTRNYNGGSKMVVEFGGDSKNDEMDDNGQWGRWRFGI
jgi:hypothetical protein